MGLKTMLAMTAAAIGGIYLTSDEGKKARDALRKKKSAFEPIVRKLLKQANEVLEGTQKLDSKEIKINIQKLIGQAKKELLNINLDKTTETAKEAIRVASKKIREAANEKNYSSSTHLSNSKNSMAKS